MEAAKTNPFGPARILALIVIALGALGLTYLHFATRDDSVSVPAAARAGQLDLHSCDYATEDGDYRADCGTLVVKENRHKATSRLIALPVTRIRARSRNSGAPIFRLQGGPGITNMTFPAASRFADNRDVVMVGYRGVEGSSKLDCPEVTSARERHEMLTTKGMRADAAGLAQCAERLRGDGVDLAGYTLPQRVEDLEAARRALGYDRINLLSESLGTRTAMIYAWRHPERIARSVMIGVNPPGHFLWDAETIGRQVERYAALCARDASCRKRTPDLAASIHAAYGDIPKRWWFLPIKRGNVKVGAYFGLMNATTDGAGPLAGPWTIDMLLGANDGDGSGAWFMSLMAQLLFPRGQVWGEVAATSRADAAHARRFFAARANEGSAIGSPGTDMMWMEGKLLDAWPASPDENQYARVRDSNVETLLIGGKLDFATPPQNGTRELLPHLPNGREVVLPNLGHSDDFWAYDTAASKRLVNTFLDSGRIDDSLFKPAPVDFTPTVGQDGVAKIVAGSWVGLAALSVLSLLWMTMRVLRRGAFGRKASVTLRSVYALVLGFGGWLLGALIVLVAFPTVPIIDEQLVILSVAIPVGLGIHLASRSGGAGTRLAAAVAGALVGAWLGFHVTTAAFGTLAPFLAIIGSTLGSNLLVLGVGIRHDRAARAPEGVAAAQAATSV